MVLREWGRIGCIGFGGPPAHIALLRELCVRREGWIGPEEFEDAIAACNLLPGPSSTQLAILCARQVGGPGAALLGGLAFILPGLGAILALAVLFLAGTPPTWVRAAAAGAGAAVAPVALRSGAALVPASWRRARGQGRVRFCLYLVVGAAAAATVGPLLVVALIGCGLLEVFWRRGRLATASLWPTGLIAVASVPTGGLIALAWVALKVGALSFGGGFVIVPLMQHDAVSHYHWMTSGQFLGAVALGQVTPGPLVQTVALVGYAAAGVGGGLLAAFVAFAPSFLFIMAAPATSIACAPARTFRAFSGGLALRRSGRSSALRYRWRWRSPSRGRRRCSPAARCCCCLRAEGSCLRCCSQAPQVSC